MSPVLVAALFISLTSPDGEPIYLSPKSVSGLRPPYHGSDNMHPMVRCIVTFGPHTVGVTETCAEVKRKLEREP